MSKLGRYSAQRRKVAIISAAKTVEVSECGTTFEITAPDAANYSVTLPSVAAAGAGWWCRFVLLNDDQFNVDIVAGASSSLGDFIIGQIPASNSTSTPGTGSSIPGAFTASFVGEVATMGDTLEVEAHPGDGSTTYDLWYCHGVMSASAAITGSDLFNPGD